MGIFNERRLPATIANNLDAEITLAGPANLSEALADEIAMRTQQLSKDLGNLKLDRQITAENLATLDNAIDVVEMTIADFEKLSIELDSRIESKDTNIIKVEKIAEKFHANSGKSGDDAAA